MSTPASTPTQTDPVVAGQAIKLLTLATTALRDLTMGYAEEDIASMNGEGLSDLLVELVTFLHEQGIDDDGGWDCLATSHLYDHLCIDDE